MKTRFSEINLIKELSSPRYHDLQQQFVARTFVNKALIFGPRHDDNLVYLVEKGQVRVYLAMELFRNTTRAKKRPPADR